MKDETLQALKDSISHWEKNVELAKEGKSYNNQAWACALCERFRVNGEIECHKLEEKCPVYKKTDLRGCDGSPWMATNEFTLEAAEYELEFLKSLLPEGEEL